MKGIILAGGMGTRLLPLTQNDNKHLLPVYGKRMIEYPIRTLVDSGIRDIIIVTGGKKCGGFLELLGNGRQLGIERLFYSHQEGSGGIPEALKQASPFVDDGEPCVVILGDNFFEDGISSAVDKWKASDCSGSGIILKEVEHPCDFGVASIDDETGAVTLIEEKPLAPKSNMAVTGCYLFDYRVWEYAESISKSERGESEIVDILNQYLKCGDLSSFKYFGYWNDMGTLNSLHEVSVRVARSLLQSKASKQ